MLTLGMIVRNEEDMLRRTLSVMPNFRRLIALDTGSADKTIDLLEQNFFHAHRFVWGNDYSEARNTLLDRAVTLKEEWMLQLDADEAMFPCDIIALERLCKTAKEDVISLPRFNLAHHGTLQCTENYPDWQARCIRIGSNVRFELPVHEVIKAPQYQAEGLHIYHYGFCKSPRQNWLRSHNYELIAKGEPLLTEAPEWVSDDSEAWIVEMQKRHAFIPFHEIHPLRGLI